MSKITIQVKKTKTQKIILPFNGKIEEDQCQAVRLNYRLHTQCSRKKDANYDYCKVCLKQIDEKTKLPPYGNIYDRAKVGLLDYVDPTGKKTVPYYKILSTLKITQEQILEEAKRLHYEIPDINWKKQEIIKRGRPKKEYVNVNGFEKERERMREEYLSGFKNNDEINVRSFYHKGKIYLKSEYGSIWDIDTEKYVGYFDTESNSIISGNTFELADEE
jgi:hypothetical protein